MLLSFFLILLLVPLAHFFHVGFVLGHDAPVGIDEPLQALERTCLRLAPMVAVWQPLDDFDHKFWRATVGDGIVPDHVQRLTVPHVILMVMAIQGVPYLLPLVHHHREVIANSTGVGVYRTVRLMGTTHDELVLSIVHSIIEGIERWALWGFPDFPVMVEQT